MEKPISNACTVDRLKENVWLLILALSTIIIMFISLYLYYQNVEHQKRNYEINAALVSAKSELILTGDELNRTKSLLEQSATQKLTSMADIAEASYKLRNRIEDVEHKISGKPRDDLKEIRGELTINLEAIKIGLDDFILKLTENSPPKSYFNISFLNSAHAQDGAAKESTSNSIIIFVLGAAIITLILLTMCFIILTSRDKERVKFAQSTIQTMIAFAIGVLGGKIS